MIRLERFCLILFICVLLAGCGPVLPPSGAYPEPPAKGEKDPLERVAVCYNTLTTTAEEVLAIAEGDCPRDTKPEFVDLDYGLDYCPVLTPARATFHCIKTDTPAPPQ